MTKPTEEIWDEIDKKLYQEKTEHILSLDCPCEKCNNEREWSDEQMTKWISKFA